MKKLLTLAAVALAGTFLAAPEAEAGNYSHGCYTYVSGYASCGCPIYTKRYIRGYDCYRRPIYGYTRLPFRHGHSCRHRCNHSRHHHSGYYHSRSRSAYPRVHVQIGRSGYHRSGYRSGYGYRGGYRGGCRVR